MWKIKYVIRKGNAWQKLLFWLQSFYAYRYLYIPFKKILLHGSCCSTGASDFWKSKAYALLEVHHSPSAGVREHLYSVCSVCSHSCRAKKKNAHRRGLPTNRTPTNGFIRTFHKMRSFIHKMRQSDRKWKVDGRKSIVFNLNLINPCDSVPITKLCELHTLPCSSLWY